jgi:uracil-DNA glycosylase family 4
MDKLARITALKESWANCEKCELATRRKAADNRQLVFGTGNLDAEIMVIGEGPGSKEEETGRPFVGASGELLDAYFEDREYPRSKVFITNLVSCRSCVKVKLNRGDDAVMDMPPSRSSISACSPRLYEQIYVVDPVIIVALGATALKALANDEALKVMKKEVTLKNWLGEVFTTFVPGKSRDENGDPIMLRYPVLVANHPAYIIRIGGLTDTSPDSPLMRFGRHLDKALALTAEYRKLTEG